MVSAWFRNLVIFLHLFLTVTHGYKKLSDGALKNLPSPGDTLDHKNGSLLSPLLITRVPGTEGSRKALQHFVDFFTKLEWELDYDNFTDTTPLSKEPVRFTNVWATLDPPWKKGTQNQGETARLVLVAHYDSKIAPKGFIGATDSAAPCAMIMHVAKSIDAPLRKRWAKMEKEGNLDDMEDEMGVMVLLLDGEEAFQMWTDTDSLYGARHLADRWENTPHIALSTYRNPLASINLFVLLDLLGASYPHIPSYFQTTHWAYTHLSEVESRLRAKSLLKTGKDYKPFLGDTKREVFTASFGISDDHIPFLLRGVEVLHLIPSPFPTVWHKMEDDGDHLDKNVVDDWAVIMLGFTVEWFELEPYLDPKGAANGVIGAAASASVKASKMAKKTEL